MKLLLDECVPRRLRHRFKGFKVSTIEDVGFKGLKNGKLLTAASADFDVLITVDKNMFYQQNDTTLPMAVILLSAYSNRYEDLEPLADRAVKELAEIETGKFIKVE